MLKRILTLVLAAALVVPGLFAASEQDLRRTVIGTRIFGALIAANLSIQSKTQNGRIPVLLLYGTDRALAENLAARLAKLEPNGLRISVQLADLNYLQSTDPAALAVFVSQWLPDLEPLLKWSRRHGAIVFSPFLGDVERGAHAGLYVTDRILPLINPPALQASGIELKPFFMDIAKRYEGH